MRRVDDTPIDPEIEAALEAIDATLAGEPVDPAHAEIAELALLLADERPRPETEFVATLDDRVQRRFARTTVPHSPRPKRWVWAPAAGLAAAAVIAVVIISGGSSGGGGSGASLNSNESLAIRPAPQAARASSAAGTAATAPSIHAAALQPPPNGRKIVQSAQLALTASATRIDTVAQEVFDVVGQQKGVVSSSTVTAGGANGYAQFQLGVPSAALPQTMAALSALRYAHVVSRTDTTQDVNDQYQADVRRLADARALRTSLLKQLAAATTQSQIDSLTARIHDAEASISSDQATLRQLGRQVDLSQVTLTITAGGGPVPASHGGGGFTIGKAAHDAGRVLTVAAGVALVALAALVPLALIAALAWWIAAAVRRRRREQALDAI